MTPSWFYVLLAAVNISTTMATKDRGSSCCSKKPYAALRPLSKIPAIASYCSSKYPPPTSTTTTTAPTVTVTVVTGSTVLTTTVDTRTNTESTVTTLTKASTTTTTTTTTLLTTITVTSPLPNLKRSAPTPAAAQLKSFTRNGASFIKTACSCIQTPRKTTKTITPTSTVRVVSTRTSAVTAIVTVTTTRTDTVTETVTTTETSETVTQATITVGPCPNGAPFASTLDGGRSVYGVCTKAAFLVPIGREFFTNMSRGPGRACALACDDTQPTCLGVQYQTTFNLTLTITCTLQTESATVLTANPTLDAAIAIGPIR
ncbi:unnamed protein product [Cercospora beticola]|nr:unnamed protein product [Cercospora beticola]